MPFEVNNTVGMPHNRNLHGAARTIRPIREDNMPSRTNASYLVHKVSGVLRHEGISHQIERSNDKHQRARTTASRVKDEASLCALRCMR